jgi:hypothetical protein
VKIGFDYWQVLSHYSAELTDIIEAYTSSGIEVVVISAVGRRRAGSVEPAVRALGFDLPVHEVVFRSPEESPQLKLAKCRELGVTAFYDDREDVCRLLSSNGVLAFRVSRRQGGASDLDAELGSGE